MEDFAKTIAIHLSIITEIIATIVIGWGLVQFIINYLTARFKKNSNIDDTWIRVKFGSQLTIALELLLAADILVTAVAPTWEEIGKLAAIVAIRTTLNFFLERELKTIKNREFPKQK